MSQILVAHCREGCSIHLTVKVALDRDNKDFHIFTYKLASVVQERTQIIRLGSVMHSSLADAICAERRINNANVIPPANVKYNSGAILRKKIANC